MNKRRCERETMNRAVAVERIMHIVLPCAKDTIFN